MTEDGAIGPDWIRQWLEREDVGLREAVARRKRELPAVCTDVHDGTHIPETSEYPTVLHGRRNAIAKQCATPIFYKKEDSEFASPPNQVSDSQSPRSVG